MKTWLVVAWYVLLMTLPNTFWSTTTVAQNAAGYGMALSQRTGTPPADLEWLDIGDGLELRYYFAAGQYAMYILGEVRNTNAEAVPSPSFSITLLDSDGNIVGTQRLIDLYPIVEPETPTPYQVVMDPSIEPESWESEEVEVFNREAYGPAECSTGLELRDVVEEDKSAEQLRISGKVYNGGTRPLDGVIVWAAVYRIDGVYAGVINESIGTTIPLEKTAAFSLFGLRVPGLLLPDSDPDYTYRLFATNTTGGSTYC